MPMLEFGNAPKGALAILLSVQRIESSDARRLSFFNDVLRPKRTRNFATASRFPFKSLQKRISIRANWIWVDWVIHTDNHGFARMKQRFGITITLSCLGLLAVAAFGQTKPLYENNFESAEAGKVPADFLVLNGNFTVKALGTNKVLELPGAPLEGFAVQFGPAEPMNMAVRARFFGTAQGKRSPGFGLGLGGAGGWRLQVSPGRKALELFKDQELKASTAYEWKASAWTHFHLQVREVKEGAWCVEGKVWADGNVEPKEWTITADETEKPVTGRASVVGSPFAGTPIWFDDLMVERVARK